jgi:hypothetical protein
MGIPEMSKLWNDLTSKAENSLLKSDENKLFKKLVKTFSLLSQNPKHNSLNTHELKFLQKDME